MPLTATSSIDVLSGMPPLAALGLTLSILFVLVYALYRTYKLEIPGHPETKPVFWAYTLTGGAGLFLLVPWGVFVKGMPKTLPRGIRKLVTALAIWLQGALWNIVFLGLDAPYLAGACSIVAFFGMVYFFAAIIYHYFKRSEYPPIAGRVLSYLVTSLVLFFVTILTLLVSTAMLLSVAHHHPSWGVAGSYFVPLVGIPLAASSLYYYLRGFVTLTLMIFQAPEVEAPADVAAV